MKALKRAGAVALAAALIAAAPVEAWAQAKPEKPGSLHVQCDGQPNNVSAGETAARLIGAVTLLALFAPPPESPDASKRKFGADGVQVCSALIDGEKPETNAARRVTLILGRAIHRIEAKEYDAAIADTALARREAEAAGLMANPYYARSRGRAFDLVEAAALYRAGRVAEAREAAIRTTAQSRYAFLTLFGVPAYMLLERSDSPAEAQFLGWRSHIAGYSATLEADRLEEWGRFADAAKIREDLIDFDRRVAPDMRNTSWLAKAAVSQALAGNAALAAERAKEARANFEKRRAEGKPERDASEIVELLDLYGIIETAMAGDMKAARRLFAARSQWVAASFGSVVEVTRRLRQDATPDERIGGLARGADDLWKERAEASRAEVLAKDSDNKTLFQLIPYADAARDYHNLSKRVWRTTKSQMVIQVRDPDKATLKMERMFVYGVDPSAVTEAYVLHAALLAKARGHQGFAIMPLISGGIVAASFITGNAGDPGLQPAVFNNAEDAIRELSPLIPDPVTLKKLQAVKK